MKLNYFKEDYILPFFVVISEENALLSISYSCMFSHFVACLTVFIQLIMNMPVEVLVSVPMKITVFWYEMTVVW
jgi:hypothetical protein